MATDSPQDAITLWEALKFLGPLVGGGGVTAIAVAWLGSKRPQDNKPDSQPAAQMGISALMSDSTSINRMSDEMRRLTDAIEEVARVGGRMADMMDIASAVERLTRKHD